jgi:serine/threonine protein phosphatase PrpC
MSTQRFMARTGKGSGHFTLALLVGALLALQCLLPAGAFARSKGPAGAFSSTTEQNYIRDKAGVSIVRLVATYANGAANSRVTCTGLGILVASIRQGSTYQNQVLTDGNLVRTKLSTCGSSTGGTVPLNTIAIWASTEYTGSPSLQPLGQLICTTQGICSDTPASTPENVTTDTASETTSTTLFSFQSSTGEPFLSPDFTFNSSSPGSKVVLTNGLANRPGQVYPSATVSESAVPQSYLQPEVVNPLLNPGSVPSGSRIANTTEGGTPMVSASGKLVGLFVTSPSGAAASLLTSLQTLWQKRGLPAQLSAAPAPQACADVSQTAACWNAAIDAFYGAPGLTAPQYVLADNYLSHMAMANKRTVFKAPASFEALAAHNIPSHGPSSPQTTSPGSSAFPQPLLIDAAAALVVLILLLVLLLLLMGRMRRRRRELAHFAAEQAEARRLAEAEVQRLRAQQTRGREIACPNCHAPVRLSDAMCPHCRFPLSPTASGLNIRLMGNAPLPAASISEQPTVQFPPAPVATANGGGEAPSHRQRSVQENPQRTRGRNLSLAVGTRSDPGIKRKHKPNEDSLFAIQGARTHNSQPQQFALFVVADGMGGHANGQDASRLAIQTMIDFMLPRVTTNESMDDEAFLKLMSDGVQHANQAVHMRNLEERADMGTTMTTALVAGSTAYVANVGDSRTYFYREGQGLAKVTNDHSVVASLVEAGIIQPDDIYTHPKRNQIYRSLGEKSVVEVDTFKVHLQAGDKLLLCTDGLWDMTRDPIIQQIMSQAVADPNRTSQELIRTALEGGGEDNVSVIVAQFSETSERSGRTGVQLLAKPESVKVPDLPQT